MISTAYNQKDFSKLYALMKKNTSVCYDKVENQEYSWGKNKCIISCNDISSGWEPEDIIIKEFQSSLYMLNDDIIAELNNYKMTDQATEIVNNNKNMSRCMLTNYAYVPNDKFGKIHISLQKTDYLTTSFFWNRYKNSTICQKQQIMDELFHKKLFLPNSLCLHLALLTDDDQVVMTSISTSKSNDYPSTWAVTIGEQLEISDFKTNFGDINKNFVNVAVKRALYEEFGIRSEQFDKLIQNDGIRILSLNSEGDINNISMMIVAHLSCNFDDFILEVSRHQKIDDEFSSISTVRIDDIPYILFEYEKIASRMHPSSFLRLLLCFLHKRDIISFVERYEFH